MFFWSLQYTAIPDVAFETALIAGEIDSEGTLDGQILTVDAEGFSGTLNLNSSGVLDMTGIEAFINMAGLNFDYNDNITALNLNNNTALELITAEGCSSLTSINIDGLTSLTSLYMPDCALTSIDVSSNTALETLNVRASDLTSVDLSLNTALTSVDVKDNALTFLDVRNGTNSNITFFDSDFNGSLLCIFVDDAEAAYLTTWSIDSQSNFVSTEEECNTLSRDGLVESYFKMYPNPATNNLKVTNTSTQQMSLDVFDFNGRLVFSNELEAGENSIDVTKFSPGMYLVKFTSDRGVKTKKLIIN